MTAQFRPGVCGSFRLKGRARSVLLRTVLPLWVAMARWSGLHTTLLLSRRVVVKPARRRKRPAILVTLSGTETDPGNDSWTEMTPRLSD